MNQFRVLDSVEEYQEYLEGYYAAFKGTSTSTPLDVNAEDLKRVTRVVGIYQRGKMVGGYCLNDVPEVCLELIDAKGKEQMLEFSPLETYCDLGKIWKHRSMRSLAFSLQMWSKIVWDSAHYNPAKKYIVGYCYSHHGRAQSYFRMNPLILYRDRQSGLTIFCLTSAQMLKGFGSILLHDVCLKSLGINRPLPKARHLADGW